MNQFQLLIITVCIYSIVQAFLTLIKSKNGLSILISLCCAAISVILLTYEIKFIADAI